MDEIPPGGTLTTAPPPPPEVKIRTMRSDIASMAASGGGLPRFENVKVTGLSAAQASHEETTTAAARTESKSNLLLIVVLVVALAALGVIGWLVYMKFG